VADLYQTHGPEAVAALILSATTLAKTGQGWTQAEPLAPDLPERTPAAAAIVAQGQGITAEAWQVRRTMGVTP
jgi:hypothetical protein